jgi:hypothetical protein
VDLRIDGVDLLAQFLQRGRGGGRLRHLQTLGAGSGNFARQTAVLIR